MLIRCQKCGENFKVTKVSDIVKVNKQVVCPECLNEITEPPHNLQGRFESQQNFGADGRYTKAQFRGRT
jgi:DNA-directed RNA polymerase subunit RPC12/RpoP